MSKHSAKDKHFLKQPIFKGGKKAMDQLVKMALVYPKEALKNNIEGSVYLRYEIDFKGKVSSTKVLSSLGYGCDEEAARVVRLFSFEVPKIPRKMKVLFHKNIRIHFKLPKQKKQEFNYKIIGSRQKENKKNLLDDNGYHYTISW